MSEQVNHEAAKVQAELFAKNPQGYFTWETVNYGLAYLDLDAKLTEMNKYMSDCTPLQSDDFSRGESYGADCCARLIDDVLNGKTDGVMCEPLGSARQRLIDRLVNLDAKLEAERHRVDRLVELVEDMHLETNKHWQIEETGKWNDQLERSFREMFQKSKAKLAIDTIMEGRDNGYRCEKRGVVE